MAHIVESINKAICNSPSVDTVVAIKNNVVVDRTTVLPLIDIVPERFLTDKQLMPEANKEHTYLHLFLICLTISVVLGGFSVLAMG